jgi:excisionase family DNA binding protein
MLGRMAEDAHNKRRVLTPAEVARRFSVDPKTVTRWAMENKIPSFRTPAGTRRYYEDEIDALIEATRQERSR